MGFHPESSCMKNTIDLMAQSLEEHHLEDFIPDNARKNPLNKTSSERDNGHASLSISLLLILGCLIKGIPITWPHRI
jgi:hypothetical protein